MRILYLAAALGLAGHLGAQATPEPPSEARQFDFWLGEWTVTDPTGKEAGTSRIERMAGGWGLLENWSGRGGYSGKSLNTWEADRRQWRQFWVGAGDLLELSGGLDQQGRMVLQGRAAAKSGGETLHRITWTPNPDGTVRQLWQTSADGGATWATAFDGLYRRRG